MTARGDIRLIAADLDNTLLRSDKTLSSYTLDVLARYREKGILLMFATARPWRTIVGYIEAACPDAVAVHNGAVVVYNGNEIARHGIAAGDRDRMLKTFLREFPQHTISAEVNDMLYSNVDLSAEWDNVLVTVTEDFSCLPALPAEKLLLGGVTEPEHYRAIEARIEAPYYAKWIEKSLVMIMHGEAEKARAVSEVCAVANIPLNQAVAFGDDVTDIPMLRLCGTGVAVDNALDEVKAAANMRCASNDEDGVARWLEEWLLL